MGVPAQRRWRALWLVPVLAGALHVPARSEGLPAVEPPSAPPMAVILHLEGGPTPGGPTDARSLRLAAHDVLAALTGAAGIMVCDRTLTEDLVRRHRLRSSSVLTPAFLEEVRGSLGAPTLVAVSLAAEAGSLAASIRLVDTLSGRVTAVGLADAEISGGDWQRALVEVLRHSFPAGGRIGTAPTLLILPARGVALDPQTARAATHSILDAALGGGRWSIMDPALVSDAALSAGCETGRLDADGRSALRLRFGTDWAVVPEIVSYGFTPAAPNLAAPEIEGSGGRRPAAAELVLTLRLLDLRTGSIVGARSSRAPGVREPGWFGLDRPQTLLGQLRACAVGLWPDFHRLLEDASS